MKWAVKTPCISSKEVVKGKIVSEFVYVHCGETLEIGGRKGWL